MNVSEVVNIADRLIFQSRSKHLNDLERSIIEGVCEGKKYKDIGKERTPPCTEAHVSEIAANLWKAISENLGEDVKKSNLQSAIERYNSSIIRSHCWTVDTINLCSDPKENNREANSNKQKDGSTTRQYLKNIPDLDRLFSSGELAGNYTEEYREYRELFRRIWETNHQSCVLLLSREEPSELAVMLENNSSIHSLSLGELGEGGREIFRAKGLGDEDRWDYTIDYLGGNLAYLESVSSAIKKLFGGKVGEFCKYEELFLTEEIESLLTHQFSRLSTAEQEVIKLLAVEAAPIGISRSIESLNMSPADVGKAIVSLGRRGLIKQGETDDGIFFSLRSIVKNFILQL